MNNENIFNNRKHTLLESDKKIKFKIKEIDNYLIQKRKILFYPQTAADIVRPIIML